MVCCVTFKVSQQPGPVICRLICFLWCHASNDRDGMLTVDYECNLPSQSNAIKVLLSPIRSIDISSHRTGESLTNDGSIPNAFQVLEWICSQSLCHSTITVPSQEPRAFVVRAGQARRLRKWRLLQKVRQTPPPNNRHRLVLSASHTPPSPSLSLGRLLMLLTSRQNACCLYSTIIALRKLQ